MKITVDEENIFIRSYGRFFAVAPVFRFCYGSSKSGAYRLAGKNTELELEVFSSDLLDWDTIKDHNNLVRGYILENYYMLAHPKSKLAEMQTYGDQLERTWVLLNSYGSEFTQVLQGTLNSYE